MMDTLMVVGTIILYFVMIYILEVKILNIDPYKNPWDGNF